MNKGKSFLMLDSIPRTECIYKYIRNYKYELRNVVFQYMNEGDMKKRGWQEETIVHLYSQHKGIKREALTFQVVPYPIPRGNVATYFPEANPLVPIDLIARKSKTPVSKCVPITIEKA